MTNPRSNAPNPYHASYPPVYTSSDFIRRDDDLESVSSDLDDKPVFPVNDAPATTQLVYVNHGGLDTTEFGIRQKNDVVKLEPAGGVTDDTKTREQREEQELPPTPTSLPNSRSGRPQRKRRAPRAFDDEPAVGDSNDIVRTSSSTDSGSRVRPVKSRSTPKSNPRSKMRARTQSKTRRKVDIEPSVAPSASPRTVLHLHGLPDVETTVNEHWIYVFFRFIAERHRMHERRESGVPRSECSQDETMRKTFVGNVFRELDRGSVKVREEIMEQGDQSLEEVCCECSFSVFCCR
jgi:hypothetical protein